MDDIRVGSAVAAERQNRGGLRIGNSVARKLEQRELANARVFQICESRSCEHRLASGAMPRDLQNDGVGEAGEAHGLKFAGRETELIELCQFDDGGLGHLGANQTGNIVARVEWLVAAAVEADHRYAADVGKSASAGGGDLRNLRRGYIQRLELLN